MASIDAAGINLDTTWGSVLAGVFVSLVFYGIGILQTFIYYGRYPKDPVILKSLVAFVFVLDTLHTFLISVGVWQCLILHFGDETFLMYTNAPMLISVVVTSVISSSVQSFFIYRIWSLTRNRFKWVFPVVLIPFVVAQLVLGAFYVVTLMNTSAAEISTPLLLRVGNGLDGLAAAVDITITIALCTLLIMGRTGFEDTDRMILRLIFISVNTGLSSAIFAFLAVILMVIYPNDLIVTAFYLPLGTVYCNTLLANLNAWSYALGGGNAPAGHQHTALVWHVASTDMGADDLLASRRHDLASSSVSVG
ncbi:hypothetical protein PAXINDRAFT_20892 [Paxillus involutus ATCC 200175]|uniref:DUF6534 domain-containing protein n=1 Tax=Paxillus involutus ATCC 200175 TaxID=664439 RepID=A0A0C9TCD3_PAXIN|nr:hypothetical protein PAXINDRAFT_20892 [Paxillus involutus ATCC 200175]